MNSRFGRTPTLLGALISAAAVLAPLPGSAQRRPAAEEQAYERCMALAESKPQQALAQAAQWRNKGGGYPAEHCEGAALYNLQQYAEAAQRFHEVAEAMPADAATLRADAYDQSGQAYLMANQPIKARAEFDSALNLAPLNIEMLIDRAQANGIARNYWDAIDDLNTVLDLDGTRADALTLRASAYRRVDSYDLALEDANRAIKIAPNFPDAYLERGDLRLITGDLAAARGDFQKVMQLEPNTPVAAEAQRNIAQLDAMATPPAKPGPTQ